MKTRLLIWLDKIKTLLRLLLDKTNHSLRFVRESFSYIKNMAIVIKQGVMHYLDLLQPNAYIKKHWDKMKIISPRWSDILLISFLSFMIIFAVKELLIDHQSIDNWIDKIYYASPIEYWSLYILLGMTIRQTLKSIGDYTVNHLITNPPLWISVIIAIMLLFIFDTQPKSVALCLNILKFSFPVIVVLISTPIALFIKRLFFEDSKKKQAQTITSQQPERLIDWLYNESPIEEYNSDKFNRDIIVNRIATRLNSDAVYNRGECLLGDYGSGKSSVINLVTEKLQSHKNDWLICKFDSWGRIENAKQAQALILEKMIESIGEHTSVSAIKNLPQNYLDALQGNDSWWNTLFSIFNASSLDPEAQLRKINNILSAIDKKLLLVIEDLDRNSDCNKLSLEIVPLLDRLEKLTKVKFIITLGYEEHLSSAITRVTSFREDLLKIKHEELDAILREFRDECVTGEIAKDDYIDGAYDLNYWPMVDGKASRDSIGIGGDNSIFQKTYTAIKYYLDNPRTLKHCLRHVHHAWKTLHGEVNFDDLLCLKIIETAESTGFDFIAENINKLIRNDNNSDSCALFRKMLMKNKCNNEEQLTNLMVFLFPHLQFSGSLSDNKQQQNNNHVKTHDIDHAPRLQAIVKDIRYFNSIIDLKVDYEFSESKIIKEIRDYYHEGRKPNFNTKHTDRLANMVVRYKEVLTRDTNNVFTSKVYKQVIEKYCAFITSQQKLPQPLAHDILTLDDLFSPETLKGLFNEEETKELIKHAIDLFLENSMWYVANMLDIAKKYPESEDEILDHTYQSIVSTPSEQRHHIQHACMTINKILQKRNIHSNGLFDWITHFDDRHLSIKYLYTLYSWHHANAFPLFNIESMKSFISECRKMADSFESETQQQLLELERFIETPKPVNPEPVEGQTH